MAQLRKRGVRVAVLTTEPFLKLARNQSRVLGVPDLPLLIIPHPLGGISLEQIRARADHALPELLDMLRDATKPDLK